jgi:peptidoglycan/xylan/chitin deacetylase (PgdA/CDA1 family)
LKKVAWFIVFALCLFCLPLKAGSDTSKICSNQNLKLIALTFDDGPKEKFLNVALPIFEKNGIKATFFVNGCNFNESNKKLLVQMSKDGHSIQNHTYGHGNFKLMEKKYGRAWIIKDVDKNASLIKECTGKNPTFLRPPFWVIWPDLQNEIENKGYHVLTLSVDINPMDYELSPKEETRHQVIENILRAIDSRERQNKFCHIIVLHEIVGTAKILPEIIEKLKSRGYQFKTVEEVYPCAKGGKR